MRDDLLYYYERELAFLRRMGAEFAQKYPKVASRLLLEPNKCDDPHVERLLEGFAFLAARVHLRIDEDFPEISEALLNVLYPHYIRPTPSMSVVQFHLDPEQGKISTGLRIPRESTLYSAPVRGYDGVRCAFRTCYETLLWPLSVASAKWMAPYELNPPVRSREAVAALRVEVECFQDVLLHQTELDTLRFHINGEPNLTSALYELLGNNCREILVRDTSPGGKGKSITLPASALKPVGFGEDEGMLPLPHRNFLGYRLLQEYFTFPDKFYFFDLSGFDRMRAAEFGSRVEIIFLISTFERADRKQVLESGVNASTFRLGCSPVVNLFPQTSEPIRLTQRQHEYLLVADARRRATTGIFSVDEVTGVTHGRNEVLRFEPLYSFRHGVDTQGARLFWSAHRRPALWRTDKGTEVHLSFADDAGQLVQPDLDTITAKLTCFNADLPSHLPFGDAQGDFKMPGGGPVQKIVALVKPTSVIQPPLGRPQLWRLISQLSLNYVSLIDGGTEALQELLRLHNFAESSSGQRQIEGIVGLRGSPAYARIESEHGLTFARGQRIEIDFDEEQFTGGSVFLFASVLERFLGLYVSLNSFSILSTRTRQRKEILREWSPRAGKKVLL